MDFFQKLKPPPRPRQAPPPYNISGIGIILIGYYQRCCRGPGGVVCVVLIFEKRPLYLVLKGSKNFACGFKTTFFQKFLLKPHPNPFLLRFCVLKCGFNQICSKKCIFGPKIPYFFKIFGAFGAETCGFNPIFFAMPCGSGPQPYWASPPP